MSGLGNQSLPTPNALQSADGINDGLRGGVALFCVGHLENESANPGDLGQKLVGVQKIQVGQGQIVGRVHWGSLR